MIIPNETCDGFDTANKYQSSKSKTYKELITSKSTQDLQVRFESMALPLP